MFSLDEELFNNLIKLKLTQLINLMEGIIISRPKRNRNGQLAEPKQQNIREELQFEPLVEQQSSFEPNVISNQVEVENIAEQMVCQAPLVQRQVADLKQVTYSQFVSHVASKSELYSALSMKGKIPISAHPSFSMSRLNLLASRTILLLELHEGDLGWKEKVPLEL